MQLTPEYLVERRSHKLQIKKWKILAVLSLLLLIAVSGKKLGLFANSRLPLVSYIGQVTIDEVIFEDKERDKKLEKIAEDDQVKALIVDINSPGGTVVGAEKIYNALRKIAAKKPVVAVMGTVAASGGYLISLGADYIIAHNGTITGSMGVIMQTAEITELAEKIGIKFNNFKTGELKAAPNPTEKLTPAVHDAIMDDVFDSYEYFVELIAERRGFTIDEAKNLADGRVYSGRRAHKLKLIDAVGSSDSALKWLQDTKNIDAKLEIKEIKLKAQPRFRDMLLDELGTLMPSVVTNIFKNKAQGLQAIYNH